MNRHKKAQLIRLLDVFAIGPLMIYAGIKAKEDLSPAARTALVVTGIGTIGYNGLNYLENEKDKQAAIGDRLTALVGDVEG